MIPFATQTVVRLRGVKTTDAGNSEYIDWSNPDELVITKVNIQPLQNLEMESTDRSRLIDRWRLFCTGTPDIKYDDRIVYGDLRFTVDGQPSPWEGPIPHLYVDLRADYG